MDAERIEKLLEIKVKRAHAILLALIAVITPPLTAYSSYVKAMADIKVQFAELRLESEQKFVKGADLKIISEKLDRLTIGVSRIEGHLERRSRSNARRDVSDSFALREDR